MCPEQFGVKDFLHWSREIENDQAEPGALSTCDDATTIRPAGNISIECALKTVA